MTVRSALEVRGSREWVAWEKYEATWSSTGTQPAIGNGAITAKFKRTGVTATLRGAIAVGTTTTFGTGEWRISMPTDWAASADPIDGYQQGDTLMVPTAGNAYQGRCWAAPGGTVLRMVTIDLIAASVTNLVPASWTQNAANFLSWEIDLELAA